MKILVKKSEGRRQFGSHRRRCGCMDWSQLAQDTDQFWALVNTVMNLWVP